MAFKISPSVIPAFTEGCCDSLPIRMIQLGMIPNTPSIANVELREDGSYELREDGSKELREN